MVRHHCHRGHRSEHLTMSSVTPRLRTGHAFRRCASGVMIVAIGPPPSCKADIPLCSRCIVTSTSFRPTLKSSSMKFEYHSPNCMTPPSSSVEYGARFIGRRVDAKGNFLDDLPGPVIGFRPDMREILDCILEQPSTGSLLTSHVVVTSVNSGSARIA